MAILPNVTKSFKPVLYILMRDDLDSLNPGKAIAQGAHAVNMFEKEINSMKKENKTFSHRDMMILEAYGEWSKQANGFGTTITLSVDNFYLHEYINKRLDNMGFPAGLVHDPSYPIRDGSVTHLIPLNTCGYAFVFDNGAAEYQHTKTQLKLLQLYK